jgi:VCBS repeat-containing protein
VASYVGSNALDDVMGAGTATPGTAVADRWSSGAGSDTLIYGPSTAAGADRFSGGPGRDTVEFRLTVAEWENATIRTLLTNFKALVDSRVSGFASGEVSAGTGYSPLSFGINKSLTVLEAENVRVLVNNQLVLGTAAHSRTGTVKEAGVDGNFAALAGVAQATGYMPRVDDGGDAVATAAVWSVTGLPSTRYGNFSITSNGQWTYVLDNDNPQTQGLQEGQAVTQVFQVAATWGTAAAFSSVAITIEGSNDRATAVVVGNDFSVTERGGQANELVGAEGDGASGSLLLSNADGAPPSTPLAQQPYPASVKWVGLYGDLVVTRGETTTSSTTTAPGQQTTAFWSYTLRNFAAPVQALADQQVVWDRFQLPANSFDGATNTFNFRVLGADDWAVLSALDGADLSVTEAGGVQNGTPGDPQAGGWVSASDPDTAGPLTFAPLGHGPVWRLHLGHHHRRLDLHAGQQAAGHSGTAGPAGPGCEPPAASSGGGVDRGQCHHTRGHPHHHGEHWGQ